MGKKYRGKDAVRAFVNSALNEMMAHGRNIEWSFENAPMSEAEADMAKAAASKKQITDKILELIYD
jgi:hypothetical protein